MLAPLGGYLLARRATRPLQRIIAASRSLHPSRLEERLPLRNTGDELDQLSAEINQFLDQIAAYLQQNRDFVANAAHELRSPLTALMTSVEVALTRVRSISEYQELLATVQEECRNLAIMANQLLLLAESDAGLLSAHQSPVRLDAIARSAIDMFLGVAEEKGLQLKSQLDHELWVMGESTRLRQVVNNLLDNAIKFTAPGGTVEVSVKKNGEPNLGCLEVRDTGIGIRDDDQVYVFDRFFQVAEGRSHRQENPGFGLGLSICRSIVRAYGGELTLRSKVGVGSTFRVELPLSPPNLVAAKRDSVLQER